MAYENFETKKAAAFETKSTETPEMVTPQQQLREQEAEAEKNAPPPDRALNAAVTDRIALPKDAPTPELNNQDPRIAVASKKLLANDIEGIKDLNLPPVDLANAVFEQMELE